MHRAPFTNYQVRRRRAKQEHAEKPKTLPPLYEYLNKHVFIHLMSGGRKVSGTVMGFDAFQNLVLGSAIDESTAGEKLELSEIVRCVPEGRNPFHTLCFFGLGIVC